MSDLQTISITIGILTACVTVVIGVLNSIRVNRRAEEQRALTLQAQQQALETRQAQLFMQVYGRWNSRELQKAYGLVRFQHSLEWSDYDSFREFVKMPVVKGVPWKYDVWSDYQLLITYLEGVGTLVKNEFIDVNLVNDLLADRITWYWEMFRVIAEGSRRILNDPSLYDSTEYLYHEVKKLEQQSIAVNT
jgi:hypothetical protein